MNLLSAYLLTYDNMVVNTKNWVDLGRLKSYYADFSAFRFGEIIVAHRQSKPGAGIYMLTWDGENLEDHGIQIDLDLFGGSSGVFIPKEDTKCVSVFIGETPQRDTDVEEEVIFEQQCGIKNNDAYVMKFEVECDFDKITGDSSLFMGTEDVNFPFRLDTLGSSSGGLYKVVMPKGAFETAEFFADDFREFGALYFNNNFCTKGEYVEFVMKQVIFQTNDQFNL